MTTTYSPFVVTTTWKDIIADPNYSALNSADITVQNISTGVIQIFFGGATMPGSTSEGERLVQYGSRRGSSDHIWVRGTGSLSITLE